MRINILALILLNQLLFTEIDYIDRIAIIVEDGIILESEVNDALKTAISNLKKSNNQIPPKEYLFNSVIEKLIIDEILIQKQKVWDKSK